MNFNNTAGLLNIAITAIIGFIVVGFVKNISKAAGLDGETGPEQDPDQARKRIDELEVFPEGITKPMIAYQSLADQLEGAMQNAGTNTKLMFQLLDPLTDEELKAVYKAFGVRKNRWMVLATYEGDLFKWFTEELSDVFETNNLSRMKEVWAGTKLWA